MERQRLDNRIITIFIIDIHDNIKTNRKARFPFCCCSCCYEMMMTIAVNDINGLTSVQKPDKIFFVC